MQSRLGSNLEGDSERAEWALCYILRNREESDGDPSQSKQILEESAGDSEIEEKTGQDLRRKASERVVCTLS